MEAAINCEYLIELVKENKCLYDSNLSNKGNKVILPELKQAAWTKISGLLNVNEHNCKRKWISLREKYGKELKQIEQALKSGKSYSSNWQYFESLSFLKEHIKQRKSIKYYNQKIGTSRDSQESDSLLESIHHPDQQKNPLDVEENAYSPLAEPELIIKCETPFSPASQANGGHLALESAKKRKRTTEEVSPTNLQKVMFESAELFKKVCNARLEQRKEHSDIYSFSNMVAENLIAMNPQKRAKAIGRITAFLMNLRTQPDD